MRPPIPRPPEPPKDPPDPPIQYIKDDGGAGGGAILLVVALWVFAFALGMCSCTTSFDYTERDAREDTDEDITRDIAGDGNGEVAEVTEDSCDDCGDIGADGDDDAVDPCDYYPSWFRDQDMDGWGRDDLTACLPEQPDGYVGRGGDCCDVRPEVNPGAEGWHDEPYVCPEESWDWNCDGDVELRWPGSDPDLCDPAPPNCTYACQDVTDEDGCLEMVWWPGEVPGCGETDPTYMGWCNWAGGCYLLTGTDFLHQACR